MPVRRKNKSVSQYRLPELIVTLIDFNARKKIWSDYYKKVSGTKAYKRFIEQKEALAMNNLVRVKELAQEARQDMIDGIKELVTPPFPDPEIEKRNGRLGVKEWMLNTLDPANEVERSAIIQIENRFDQQMIQADSIFNS